MPFQSEIEFRRESVANSIGQSRSSRIGPLPPIPVDEKQYLQDLHSLDLSSMSSSISTIPKSPTDSRLNVTRRTPGNNYTRPPSESRDSVLIAHIPDYALMSDSNPTSDGNETYAYAINSETGTSNPYEYEFKSEGQSSYPYTYAFERDVNLDEMCESPPPNPYNSALNATNVDDDSNYNSSVANPYMYTNGPYLLRRGVHIPKNIPDAIYDSCADADPMATYDVEGAESTLATSECAGDPEPKLNGTEQPKSVHYAYRVIEDFVFPDIAGNPHYACTNLTNPKKLQNSTDIGDNQDGHDHPKVEKHNQLHYAYTDVIRKMMEQPELKGQDGKRPCHHKCNKPSCKRHFSGNNSSANSKPLECGTLYIRGPVSSNNKDNAKVMMYTDDGPLIPSASEC